MKTMKPTSETEAGPLSYGADLIKAERLRQIREEGWTAARDDGYTDGELLLAAIVYAAEAHGDIGPRLAANVETLWPWHESWLKTEGGPIRCLTKAGALIAAEIDRLKRLEAVTPPPR